MLRTTDGLVPAATLRGLGDVGESRIAAVLRVARSTGREQTLRVATQLTPTDAWTLLPSIDTSHGCWSAWSDGALSYVSVGEVDRIRCDGHDRFVAARRARARLAEGLHTLGRDESGAPLLVGGFAFDESVKDGPEGWGGWPALELVLPASLLVTQAGRTTLYTHLVVSPREELERAQARLDSRIYAVVNKLGRGRAVPATSRRRAAALSLPARALEARGAWVDRVARAREAATTGALDKVVLARATVRTDGAFDSLSALHSLRDSHPSAAVFAIGRRDGSVFLGATPETLARVADRRIETHALAGTTHRGADQSDDQRLAAALLASPKDREEHAFVVDAIRESLEPLCSELEIPTAPKVVRLSTIQHLATSITGKLRDEAGLLDLVERLHPTPAVGGWPRAEARRWLAETESLERGWYAGAVGWIGEKGDGVMAVAIRSALVRGRNATLFAGAGIVADSDPDAEWRETCLKLRTAGQALLSERGRSEVNAHG